MNGKNSLLRIERRRRAWSQQQLADFAEVSLSTVERTERGESIRVDSMQRLCACLGKSAEELGLLGSSTPFHPAQSESPVSSQPDTIYSPQNNMASTIVLDTDSNVSSVGTPPQTVVISPPGYDNEAGQNEMERRDFLKATGVTLLTARSIDLDNYLLDRFFKAMKKPSTIDTSALTYLEKRTESYWLERHGAVLAASDLFSYVTEHFHRIVSLLEGSYLPSVRARLCATASWTALLVGELLMDMSHYSQARKYHQAGIVAAQEANNLRLEAVAWGRASLGWIYSKNMSEAFTCIQKARHLLIKADSETVIHAWSAAIEAEIQANMSNPYACLKALEEAEALGDQKDIPEDNYMIFFDQTLLRGYQGVCFRRLYHSDDAKSAIFLEKAQGVLADALISLDPALKQRRPTFLADLADTYIRQGEIEEASRLAIQALTSASEIKLQKVVQRIHTLRQELETWKNTPYIKELDRHLLPSLKRNV